MASRIKDRAAPRGQLNTTVNWSSMTVPSRVPARPPRIRGSMKEPMTGTKVRITPANRPGTLSGRMMRRKMTHPEAPRVRAASMSAPSMACRET